MIGGHGRFVVIVANGVILSQIRLLASDTNATHEGEVERADYYRTLDPFDRFGGSIPFRLSPRRGYSEDHRIFLRSLSTADQIPRRPPLKEARSQARSIAWIRKVRARSY